MSSWPVAALCREPSQERTMYTQGLNASDTDKPCAAEDAGKLARFQAKVDTEDKIKPNDWMPEAYRRTLTRHISQHAHSEIIGMPAGGQLDRAGAIAQAQGGAAGQGAGRGGPRPLSLCGRRDARHLARGDGRPAARGQSQVFLDLQLSDAVVGRHQRHRLAGRRRRHHEPDPALPLQLRPLRARHDPHLQGGSSTSAKASRSC